MQATLNNDCWILIIDRLFGDFRSLARIMQTSKHFLVLTAPRLYAQLGHPSNTKVTKNWSLKKRSSLATLLFTSSGCIDPSTDKEDFLMLYRRRLSLPTIQFYETPLTLDYFGFLKQLPLDLVGEAVWKVLIEDEKQDKDRIYKCDVLDDFDDLLDDISDDEQDLELGDDTVNRQIDRRHARVFTEMIFKTERDLDRWLACTEEFAQLSKITLHSFEPYSDLRTKAIEFVTRHKAAFPGQLIEIDGAEKCLMDFVMELNQILVPERIRLRETYKVDSLSANEKTSCLKNVKEFIYNGYTKTEYRGLSKDELLMEVRNLDLDLSHCRHLERIEIHLWRFVLISWVNLLSWAPKERLEYQLAKSTIVSSRLPSVQSPATLTSSSSSSSCLSFPVDIPPESRSLVPVKEFIGLHMPATVLVDVLDGFRYTLEKIVFRAMHQNHMDWSWSLSRLRTLRLSRCHLFLSKIKLWCPALEELYLEACVPKSVNDETATTWQLPNRLKRLSLIRGIGIMDLYLESIGELSSLETLNLSYTHTDATRVQNAIKLPTWNLLPTLRHLRLDGDANLEWQEHLLQAAPMLESFASPDRSISFAESWWGEAVDEQGQKDMSVGDKETENPVNTVEDKKGMEEGEEEVKDEEEEEEEDEDEDFNGMKSNIKSLRFASDEDWNYEKILDFSAMLQYQKSPILKTIEEFQQSSLPLLSLNPLDNRPSIFFPFLNQVRFDCRQPLRSRNFRCCAEFDRLLLVLMSRPRMRRVLTEHCWPTPELIETQLEQVKVNEVPASILRIDDGYDVLKDGEESNLEYDDGNDDESWDERSIGRCVLIVRSRKFITCYRLLQ